MLVAVRCRKKEEVAELVRAAPFPDMPLLPHGEILFCVFPEQEKLQDAKRALLAWIGERPVAAELFDHDVDEAALVDAKKHLGESWPTRPRLFVSSPSFENEEARARRRRFAHLLLDEAITCTETAILVDPARGRKRLAVLAYRHGLTVRALDGERIEVHASLWRPGKPSWRRHPIDCQRCRRELGERLPKGLRWTMTEREGIPTVEVHTTSPSEILRTVEAIARDMAAAHSLWLWEIAPLGLALRRLLGDLGR